MKNYDETTAFLGHWGRFQQIVFFVLCVSTMPNGCGVFSIIFVADTPSHHCMIPEVNLTEDWHNAIIPLQKVKGKWERSRCSRYRLDVVRNLSAQGYVPDRDVNLTDLEQERCVDGWTYSTDNYQSTIVSEFDLVCSEQWKQPFTTTLYFLGVLVGSFFAGQVSDRYGDLEWQCAGPVLNTRCVSVFYHWLHDAATLCLLHKGLEISRAGYLSAWAALHPFLVNDKKKTYEKEKRHTAFDLIRTSNIRNTTLILCLVWFTLTTGYNGLSLNTSQLGANPYISCFISAAVEVPAYISSWLTLRYFPRRLSTIFTMILGAVCLYFIQLVPETLAEVSIALEMLGKYCFAFSTAMIYVYTAELYPTVLRNTAAGICSSVSRVGSCIAPFVLQLSAYFKYLPYITLGTLAVVSSFATLFLPESFGRPLPETIQEMHKRDSMKFPCIAHKETPKPVVLSESQL
ncbi:hypothetical protein PAMP_007282 [Pampus punctatissimus]